MVVERVFIIDGHFLLADAEKAFLGSAVLVDEQGRDTSVVYGAVRELLRLRKALGIVRGIVVLGKRSADFSSKQNIELLLECLHGIGTEAVFEPTISIGNIIKSCHFDLEWTWIVTRDESLMQLITASCGIIIVSAGAPIEVITEISLASKYKLRPEQVPDFLAITASGLSESLTIKQAQRLLEIHGSLRGALDVPGANSISPKVKRFLSTHKEPLLRKLDDLTVSDHNGLKRTVTLGFLVEHRDESARALISFGFPSLTRLLETPISVDFARPVKNVKSSYVAVTDQAGLSMLESTIANARVVAVDTESTGRDPKVATLLGVALAVREGEAFYVPTIQENLRDVSVASVLSFLRPILAGTARIVGHNLKYDYVLLRRHGIEIGGTHFDTMLAAHECFGDWDFFNLGYVAKKLLDRNVKRYRDIVAKGETLLDVPFCDLVEHGCADVDATLCLYGRLTTILNDKGIANQFENDVMPRMRRLGDKELDGVSVNVDSILSTKETLLINAEALKSSIRIIVGRDFNGESMDDVAAILRKTDRLPGRYWRQSLRPSQLEQIAQTDELALTLAQYRRLLKRVGQLEAIINSVRDGKVFPLFSQVKASHGSISAANPSLFNLEGDLRPTDLLDEEIRDHIPDKNRAVDMLQELSGDPVLKEDRKHDVLAFIGRNEPSLKDLCHADVLVSLCIGFSNASISKRFLVDARRACAIREITEAKYPRLFSWIDECRHLLISSGYAQSGERRRYWDGLKSSDIDRRNRATQNALRWLIGM